MTTFTAKRSFVFPLPFDKGSITHPDVEIVKGDDAEMVFKGRDVYGDELDFTGATLEYNIASRDNPGIELISKSCTIDEATITVPLLAADFDSDGIYDGQLRATKSGFTVVIAAGRITVLPVIE